MNLLPGPMQKDQAALAWNAKKKGLPEAAPSCRFAGIPGGHQTFSFSFSLAFFSAFAS